MTGGKEVRLSKLAIAATAVACATAIGVTIWKRAGSASAQRADNGADELDKFWTSEHVDEPKPVTLLDR
jgi:hypothetical protein